MKQSTINRHEKEDDLMASVAAKCVEAASLYGYEDIKEINETYKPFFNGYCQAYTETDFVFQDSSKKTIKESIDFLEDMLPVVDSSDSLTSADKAAWKATCDLLKIAANKAQPLNKNNLKNHYQKVMDNYIIPTRGYTRNFQDGDLASVLFVNEKECEL